MNGERVSFVGVKARDFVFVLTLALLIACLGMFSFVRTRCQPPEQTVPEPYSILVHVSGCVRNPGVYQLPANSRVADAIAAAGGELAEADINRLNLAAFVSDGQKINVPAQAKPGESGLINGLVNINTADQKTLEMLPNIGPTRARRIIEYREAHGGFGSCEEILNVSGIGPKIYESIKELITY